MLRRVLVCSALFAAALFLSACSSASLSEADQQSMALVATAPATLQPGDKIRVDVSGKTNSVVSTSLIRLGKRRRLAYGRNRQVAQGCTIGDCRERANKPKARSEGILAGVFGKTTSNYFPFPSSFLEMS